MKRLDYKSKTVLDIEKKHNKQLEDILHEKYIVEMKSAQEIGGELGVSHVMINKYLLRMGIKRRFDWREIIKKCEERESKND